MAKRSQKRYKIAVLVETDNSWGCEVIQGVASFAKQSASNWDLLLDPRDAQFRIGIDRCQRGN